MHKSVKTYKPLLPKTVLNSPNESWEIGSEVGVTELDLEVEKCLSSSERVASTERRRNLRYGDGP